MEMKGGFRTGADSERRREVAAATLGLEGFVGLRGGVFFGVLPAFVVETILRKCTETRFRVLNKEYSEVLSCCLLIHTYTIMLHVHASFKGVGKQQPAYPPSRRRSATSPRIIFVIVA
jgi:hypothetical protein